MTPQAAAMHAAVVTSFDAPPRYLPFDDPVPGPGELLVEVKAAGLHQLVRSLAKGSHYSSDLSPPFVAGIDGAGRLVDGTRVYFTRSQDRFGSMADRSVAAGRMCLRLPEGVDEVVAAATANPAMSSWLAFDRAGFAAGDRVLVLGATGTAGSLAVQIAKRRGAGRVVAAGRNPQALADLPSLGADAVISLKEPPDRLAELLVKEFDGGVNVVLDYVWGGTAELTLAAIARRKKSLSSARIRYVNVGGMAGPEIRLPAAILRSSAVELLGSGFGSGSFEMIASAIGAFFSAWASRPFRAEFETAPLSKVESLWDSPSEGRLVFLP